MTGDSFPALRP